MERSQVAVTITEKLGVRENMFRSGVVKKLGCWNGASSLQDVGTEQYLRVGVCYSIQSRPLTVDFDSGLVNRDPRRLCPRRVRDAISKGRTQCQIA